MREASLANVYHKVKYKHLQGDPQGVPPTMNMSRAGYIGNFWTVDLDKNLLAPRIDSLSGKKVEGVGNSKPAWRCCLLTADRVLRVVGTECWSTNVLYATKRTRVEGGHGIGTSLNI